MKSEYEIQAEDFLKKTESILKIEFLRNGKHFVGDVVTRDIYKCTIINTKNEEFSFEFGQSIAGTLKKEKPTAYDVLACLTKYNPESFENFCSEYGYNEDSIKASEIYKKVQEEYDNLSRLYNSDEMELLREIN